MSESEGLAEEEVAQECAVDREGVVEDHGAAGTQAADPGVPREKADHPGGDADVDEGEDEP